MYFLLQDDFESEDDDDSDDDADSGDEDEESSEADADTGISEVSDADDESSSQKQVQSEWMDASYYYGLATCPDVEHCEFRIDVSYSLNLINS